MALSFNNDQESITFVINSLCGNHNLNDYEKKFVKNMKEYYIDNHGFLSDGQEKFLSKLWEKY